MSYCEGAAAAVRPAMLAIGIIGGTPAVPFTGAAPRLVCREDAATGLTVPAVVQLVGTDSGPSETARPRTADAAGPPAAARGVAADVSPAERPVPAALTVDAAAAAGALPAFANDNPRIKNVSGYVANLAGMASALSDDVTDDSDAADDVDDGDVSPGRSVDAVVGGGSVNGVTCDAAAAEPA